jgi:hypothetical protein
MAKTTGLGDNFYVGGTDLSGDTASLSKISGGPVPIDVTDITQSGYARLGGLRDGGIDWTSYFDPATAHPALSALPVTDVICTYFRGTAVGNPAASMTGKQINYDPTRDQAGAITFAVSAQANGFGLEWGTQLTAGKRTDTTATVGPFFDNLAASSFGAQAYVQLFAFSGTSVTIDIQSATTSGGVYTTTGLTTAALTSAPQAVRLSVANNTTINEFLKVVTTGTFSNAVFAVMINVNPVAGVVF